MNVNRIFQASLKKGPLYRCTIKPSPVYLFCVRNGGTDGFKSPTEHPESRFGRDSFHSGITHPPLCPPDTDLSNAGTGMIILPDEQLPGKYPVTAEDWITSARKYGIPIEEYEPYPDDGWHSAGDYPKFKPVHGLARDAWHEWQNPNYKTDWGHVMHIDEQNLLSNTFDGISPTYKPMWKMFLQFITPLVGFTALLILGEFWLPYYGGRIAPPVYLHGWDANKFRFFEGKEKVLYRFPEHPPTYNRKS